jgi:hypothetical protein
LVLADVCPAKSWAQMARQKIGEGIGRPGSYQLFSVKEEEEAVVGWHTNILALIQTPISSLVNDQSFGRADGQGMAPNQTGLRVWVQPVTWMPHSRFSLSSEEGVQSHHRYATGGPINFVLVVTPSSIRNWVLIYQKPRCLAGVKHKQGDSQFWSELFKHKDHFLSLCRFEVGNGENVRL